MLISKLTLFKSMAKRKMGGCKENICRGSSWSGKIFS